MKEPICPMNSTVEVASSCVAELCAWWDSDNGFCSIRTIAWKLQQIKERLQ